MERRPVAKVEPGLLVRLDLVDGRKDVLDRVLDRHDVAGLVTDLGQRRIERRRLPAPGRSRTQHHAEWSADEVGVGLCGVGRHSQLTQMEDGPRPVEQPHHALLAPDGGDGRHPDVDFLAVDLRPQLAILRPAALDDVHARHDLDPADQADAHGGGQCQDILERAVDPVANAEAALGRLDVDVGCPVAHGLSEDAANHLDNGRVFVNDSGPVIVVSIVRLRVVSTASNAWTR